MVAYHHPKRFNSQACPSMEHPYLPSLPAPYDYTPTSAGSFASESAAYRLGRTPARTGYGLARRGKQSPERRLGLVRWLICLCLMLLVGHTTQARVLDKALRDSTGDKTTDTNGNGIQDRTEPTTLGAGLTRDNAAETATVFGVTTASTNNVNYALLNTDSPTSPAGIDHEHALADVARITPAKNGTANTSLTSTNPTDNVSPVACVPPSVTAVASSNTLCPGQSVTLTTQVSPAGSYTYVVTGPAGITLSGGTSATALATGLPAGLSTFTVTVGSDPTCQTTVTVSVSVATTCQTAPAQLGDFVFEDVNANGQQDAVDKPLAGVRVTLFSNGTLVATTTTDVSGLYSFTGLTAGTPYSVSFTAPTGYTATVQNTGADVADSDGVPATGLTGTYSLTAGEVNTTVDMGYFRLAPRLLLDKRVDRSRAKPGDALSYTVVLTNAGTLAATNVVVRDSLSFGLTYIPGSATAPAGTTFTAGAPVSLWTLPTLAAGQSLSLTLQARADSAGILYNQATIPGDTASVCTSVPIQVCAGELYTFQLTAPAGRAVYQWFRKVGDTTIELVGQTTNVLNLTAAGEYSLAVDNVSGRCPDFTCCPFIVEDVALVGSFSVVATTPTCSGTVTLANGSLRLTGLTSTPAAPLTYQLAQGGTDFSSATLLTPTRTALPDGNVVGQNLASGTYQVRVYNALGCFVDQSVVILSANCQCPANVCAPFAVSRVRMPATGGR